MSNKTSFLGLSLLDTSSENSTHFKDWSRNINLEGDEDHKSDFQKIDEFAQKITKDLEERPAGVTSWNDLTDKPFGEVGKAPITWDGNMEGKTILGEEGDELRFVKVSDEVVKIEECKNGCVFTASTGQTFEIPAEQCIQAEHGVVMFYMLGFSCPNANVELNGTLIPEAGTYFAIGNSDVYYMSLSFPGYSFESLDEKFIPDTIARVDDVTALVTEVQDQLDNITAESLGALTTEHNTATDAHNDIRLLIEDLATRLAAIADSDDTTLDQLSEIVAYIKSNKDLIDAITTNKVSVADIVDNLTTNVVNKPLSAAQGVVLKAMIEEAIANTLPKVTAADNGKVLSVVNGKWVTKTITIDGDTELTTEEKEKLASIEMGAEVNVQADWKQADKTKDDYIKNKPDILTEQDVVRIIKENGGTGGGGGSTPGNLASVATSGSFNDLIHKPSFVLSVDNEGVLCMNIIYSYDDAGAVVYNKEEDNETGLSIEQAANVVANNNELEVN